MRLLCFKKNTLPGGKVRLTACPPPFSPTSRPLAQKSPRHPLSEYFLPLCRKSPLRAGHRTAPKGEKGRFSRKRRPGQEKKRASPVPCALLRPLRCVRKRKAPFFRLPEHPFPVLPEAAQKRPVFSAGSAPCGARCSPRAARHAPGTALPGALFPKNKRLLPLCGRACLPESPKSTFR